MEINWEMSIGYPGARRRGIAYIDDADLEGLSEEEKEELIGDVIWEDAMQYVDVYPVEED